VGDLAGRASVALAQNRFHDLEGLGLCKVALSLGYGATGPQSSDFNAQATAQQPPLPLVTVNRTG
jgi:hypothetical protein